MPGALGSEPAEELEGGGLGTARLIFCVGALLTLTGVPKGGTPAVVIGAASNTSAIRMRMARITQL